MLLDIEAEHVGTCSLLNNIDNSSRTCHEIFPCPHLPMVIDGQMLSLTLITILTVSPAPLIVVFYNLTIRSPVRCVTESSTQVPTLVWSGLSGPRVAVEGELSTGRVTLEQWRAPESLEWLM